MMDADCRVESHSGQGMYINLNNSLPEAKASDEWEFNAYYPGWNKAGWNSKYDFSSDPWQADFFFCLLGTNDWSDGNFNASLLNKTDYVARYNQFIDLVYAKYPNSTFFVVSPILDTRGWKDGNDAIIQMVADRKAAGDDIYFIDFRNLLATEQDFGGDWTHPTTVGHIKMANAIKSFMENTPSIAIKMADINSNCGAPIVDCNGVPDGDAEIDNCDVCSGGNTGIAIDDCTLDCNLDINGTAFLDQCNQCVAGLTGKTACVVDCNGDLGGTAFTDQCNVCVGGNTGNTDCAKDCDNIQFDGTAEYSELLSSGSMSTSEDNGSFLISATTTQQYDNFIVDLKNSLDFTNVVSQKIWVRAKATSNVIITPALRDVDGYIASNSALAGGNWVSTGSNVLQLTTSWKEYEIDFTGKLSEEWGCACDLTEQQITQLYFGINPGWDSQWPINDEFGNVVDAAFTGTIEIDYIKIADENCSLGGATSVGPTLTAQQVSIYPNPAGDETNIVIDGVSNYEVQLVNTSGVVVKTFNDNATNLKLNNISSGLYILVIKSDNNSIFKKVIIK
jgi:hypothetical protein